MGNNDNDEVFEAIDTEIAKVLTEMKNSDVGSTHYEECFKLYNQLLNLRTEYYKAVSQDGNRYTELGVERTKAVLEFIAKMTATLVGGSVSSLAILKIGKIEEFSAVTSKVLSLFPKWKFF